MKKPANRSWMLLLPAALLALLSLARAPAGFTNPALVVSLAALSSAAELLAASRPQGRFLSLAPAIQMLSVWLGEVPLAWLLAVLGLLPRLAFRGSDRTFLASQACSRAVQLALLQFLLPPLGALALVPAALAWLTLDRSGGPSQRVASVCCLPLLQLGVVQNLAYLWLALPALAAASRGLEAPAPRPVESGDLDHMQLRLGQTQQRLHEARQRIGEGQLRENTFWELGQRLLLCQDTDQLLTTLRLDLERSLHYQAVALVVRETPLLLAPTGLNPAMLGIPRQPGPFSLHPRFPNGWIVPLSNGYLWCGRNESSGPFQPSELAYLDTMGGLLELSWRSLEAQQQNRERLAEWLESAKTAAVGQLSAGVAHELNTPLAALRLNLDLARKRVDRPEDVLARLEAAAEPLDNAQRIIQRLLFYSRDGTLETRKLDLNQVVSDSLQFLSSEYERLGTKLSYAQAQLPLLSGHPSELQQLIVNLLDNSRQAGSRHIRLTASAEAGSVQLLVQDDGCGLAPEVAARMFEPFFTTRPPGHGVGLGLTVAQKIAQRHGGRLLGRTRQDGPGAEFLLQWMNVEALAR